MNLQCAYALLAAAAFGAASSFSFSSSGATRSSRSSTRAAFVGVSSNTFGTALFAEEAAATEEVVAEAAATEEVIAEAVVEAIAEVVEAATEVVVETAAEAEVAVEAAADDAAEAVAAVVEAGTEDAVAAADEPSPDASSKPKRQQAPQKAFEPSIYVGNLSFDTTDAELKTLFESHGAVSSVTVPQNRDTGTSRGFAFVVMPDADAAKAAIEAINETELGGRTIFASESLPKGDKGAEKKGPKRPRQSPTGMKMYVGNLDFDTSAATIKSAFEVYGAVSDVFVPVDANGDARGFAFVSMENEEAAAAIEGMNRTELDGRTINVNKSLPKGEKSPRSQQTKLYVGNLSWNTEETTIRELFAEYGEVADCYVPTDRETGESRGFAFVTMDGDSASIAIDETDGYELDGRTLRVNEAQPKGRGGGGGGGGGSYDGGSNDESWGNDGY